MNILEFIPIDILLGLSSFFITKLIMDRRAIKKEEIIIVTNELDEKEEIVLDAIRKGARTLGEVMKMTGFPKASAYRKIKSLIRKGYVKVEIKDGKRYLYAEDKKSKRNKS